MSITQIKESANQYSIESNQPYSVVVDDFLAQSRANTASAKKDTDQNSPASAGGEEGKLREARGAGDIFFTDSIHGFNHGHVGIYVTSSRVVEAPGPGDVSRNTHISRVKVREGSI
ncbi:MAG: hypothetical protein ACRCWS_01450, partial [Propionibacteriaceae bacterium]